MRLKSIFYINNIRNFVIYCNFNTFKFTNTNRDPSSLKPDNMKLKLHFSLFLLLTGFSVYSQIGIGTTTPNASSILHIESNSQGLLTPRMTTAERTTIGSPANGLLVYDTTLSSFFYYDTPTTSWVKINGGKDGRVNYKLLRPDNFTTALATELSNGGGSRYLLNANTLYEVNGTLNLTIPIELNNAYIIGLDSGDDKLIKASGDLFIGATGGSIRVLTLQAGGNVFNLTGNGSQSLILRDCIVQNSGNVGTISSFGLVFISIVNYVSNTNGIIYNNIGRLLLSNTAWFSNNSGKYETLTGTFNLVTKQGGFSEVTGTNIGFDVASNPIITGDAVVESTVFTGALTTGKYINGYNPAIYSGYNFNNNWSVMCPGIITEGDFQATGTTFIDPTSNQGAIAAPNQTTTAIRLFLSANQSSNLFRTTSISNRITYTGKKGRIFQVNCALSYDGGSSLLNSTDYVFFIMKVPATGPNEPQNQTQSIVDTANGNVQNFTVQGSVTLNTGDSVELWYRKASSNSQGFRIRTFSMTIK